MFWIYLRMIIKYFKYKSYGYKSSKSYFFFFVSWCQLQSPLLEVPQRSASEEYGHWGWCFHCRSLKWTVVKPHKKVLVPPNLNQITPNKLKDNRTHQNRPRWTASFFLRGWEPHVKKWNAPLETAVSTILILPRSWQPNDRPAHWAGPTMLQVDSPFGRFWGSGGGNGSTHQLLIIGVAAGSGSCACFGACPSTHLAGSSSAKVRRLVSMEVGAEWCWV